MLAASFTGTEATIRTFEVVSLVLYASALVWVVRMHNPLYLGAFLGATLLWAFDWTFATNGFFRVTFSEHLIAIPGLDNQGVTEPLSMPMNYALGFGVPPVLWARSDASMRRRFGAWRHPLILVGGAIGVAIYEVPVVHLLGIWTYHQEPRFMVLGFPWSDFWFAAGLLGGSAIILAQVQRWMEGTGGAEQTLSPAERRWRGLVLGAMPIWTAFYLTYMVQLFWYAATEPWPEGSPRPF
jgi:hypothetical protein